MCENNIVAEDFLKWQPLKKGPNMQTNTHSIGKEKQNRAYDNHAVSNDMHQLDKCHKMLNER